LKLTFLVNVDFSLTYVIAFFGRPPLGTGGKKNWTDLTHTIGAGPSGTSGAQIAREEKSPAPPSNYSGNLTSGPTGPTRSG
jgi:hypothetical protein